LQGFLFVGRWVDLEKEIFMKNHLLILLIINFFTLGCENQKNITDDQVIDIIREFFDAFDIENENRKENLSNLVTDDFILCELGKFYKLDEFLEFVDPFLSSTISTKWTLSDHEVTIDNNIAHSFHNNSGIFTDLYENEVKTNTHYKWLESALVVNDNGTLKLKYYQSENIYTKVDTVQ
tara:strand:- start:191 stop:727 length:537 start_codon:yes stop_codon:yes gene_type:complete